MYYTWFFFLLEKKGDGLLLAMLSNNCIKIFIDVSKTPKSPKLGKSNLRQWRMVCRSLLVDRLASFGHVGATQGSGEASTRPRNSRPYVFGLMKEPLVSLNFRPAIQNPCYFWRGYVAPGGVVG